MNNFDFLKEYGRRNEEMYSGESKKFKKNNKSTEKHHYEPKSYESYMSDTFFEDPWKKFRL